MKAFSFLLTALLIVLSLAISGCGGTSNNNAGTGNFAQITVSSLTSIMSSDETNIQFTGYVRNIGSNDSGEILLQVWDSSLQSHWDSDNPKNVELRVFPYEGGIWNNYSITGYSNEAINSARKLSSGSVYIDGTTFYPTVSEFQQGYTITNVKAGKSARVTFNYYMAR